MPLFGVRCEANAEHNGVRFFWSEKLDGGVCNVPREGHDEPDYPWGRCEGLLTRSMAMEGAPRVDDFVPYVDEHMDKIPIAVTGRRHKARLLAERGLQEMGRTSMLSDARHGGGGTKVQGPTGRKYFGPGMIRG